MSHGEFENWLRLLPGGVVAEASWQLAPRLVAAFVIAYLVGSVPFGLIIGRMAGIDIRQHGSGNIGATNVWRVLGAKFGVMVLLLDCLKGMLPTALSPLLLSGPDPGQAAHFAVLSGAAAIVGHMFPCWLGFRGGKGVATALGVVLVLAPAASGAAFLAFVACFVVSRIVSLSSLVAACAFCVCQMWLLMPAPFSRSTWSLALFSALVPLLIVVRHRANIGRICRGEEPRFRLRK
jgi:glycerol-3-phosphate acyltransferase PlsY